jgi:hypothetical protein
MPSADMAPSLPGYEAVKDWFGDWPSFHDAEVIGLTLARHGESLLRVYPYYPEKPGTVDFILEDITDVELADFSSQNVIFDLTIESAKSQNGDNVIRLALSPCYGLAGHIDAKSIHLRVVPGKSPDGVSLW